ncbi:AMP deaminase, putative [Entamoeba invadens IP1]|uniref:AMP deaminase n=1 Tax=Entamoeba invadens IP1 TaxID=370355 RepID=A0A0A1UH84_ENTIV|nr:AMP deaminase, putative [Entamoeba invadens IP1]ELP94877.1 AMP deaminase, putative [Entamoeba invadens IP1]|eukprot:XP_004261648.1 AMP deaminase, putative [Entamoeba invadens IP1]
MSSISQDFFKDYSYFTITRALSSVTSEEQAASIEIRKVLALRNKYMYIGDKEVYPLHHEHSQVITPDTTSTISIHKGVFEVSLTGVSHPVGYEDYLKDYKALLDCCEHRAVKSLAEKRLSELDRKFKLHYLLNSQKSKTLTSSEDIHTIAKVDTHIHAAACMTESQLLDFLHEKNTTSKDEVVGYVTTESGEKKLETLDQMCKRLGVNLEEFTLNQLGVRAGTDFFNRFDLFNASYKIGGEDLLRTVFLKCENYMGGKYFSELIHLVFDQLNNTPVRLELRLSIYGRSMDEWENLAEWVDKWHVSHPQNRWMIQFPRIFHVCRGKKENFTFENYIDNLFKPLFEATKNPEKYPVLSKFLESVSGFDSVDDESALEQTVGNLPSAELWNKSENPPYFYYMYYTYANIAVLNSYRTTRGMNTFDLRPHCGESGHVHHLASAYLTARGINHGIRLVVSPVLEYLYYLTQIGLAVSPLSNHNLFLPYDKSPFDTFFKCGLNVSLSSDDPLQFHRTQTPLMEEYAIAQQTWNYVTGDLAEIAYNSVLQSGFTEEEKEVMLGPHFKNFSKENSDKTRLTLIRKNYRDNCLQIEKEYIDALSNEGCLKKSRLFADIPYSKINVTYPDKGTQEDVEVIRKLEFWLDVRQKYRTYCSRIRSARKGLFHPNSRPTQVAAFDGGVFNIYTEEALCEKDKYHLAVVYCQECKTRFCAKCFRETHHHIYHSLLQLNCKKSFDIVDDEQFFGDYKALTKFYQSGPARSFCFRQLHVRSELFQLYHLLNEKIEANEQTDLKTDFDQTIKVDTHVHANRAFHPTDLLEIIKQKLQEEPDRVVVKKKEVKGVKYDSLTLKELFNVLGITQIDLHALNVQSDPSLVSRFDLWLSKYYPFGEAILKELFLSMNNDIGGEYLCSLLRDILFDRMKEMENVKTEYRFNVSTSDLYELEGWSSKLVDAGLIQPDINSYVIAIPRIYGRWKSMGLVNNFAEVLRNVFQPCFEATLHPNEHPKLAEFLKNVGAFDSPSEELLHEDSIDLGSIIRPEDWNGPEDPPYEYYLYYIYANMTVLNGIRRELKLNTYEFRPHCGQAGDRMHCAAGFLTADSITHGVTLDGQNTLQYLYILGQIGISSSPIQQSALYGGMEEPFRKLFERGMKICLSTDTPLHTHITKEPLTEEYASAMKNFKLSQTDLAEIARNSVLISSFPVAKKKDWIGENYAEQGVAGNDSGKTSIPDMRIAFRASVAEDEVRAYEKWLKNTDELK